MSSIPFYEIKHGQTMMVPAQSKPIGIAHTMEMSRGLVVEICFEILDNATGLDTYETHELQEFDAVPDKGLFLGIYGRTAYYAVKK